jgi:hypothetical protein
MSSSSSSSSSANSRRIKRKVHAAIGSLLASSPDDDAVNTNTTSSSSSSSLPTPLLSDRDALATFLAPNVRSKRARALLLSALNTANEHDNDATGRPWSRRDFLSRVESYSPIKWFSKSPALSPLVCARFGWICVGADSLQCVSCEASVSPSDDQIAADESLLSVSAHRSGCPWSKIASPARFAAAPLDADGMRRQYRSALSRLFALRRVPLLSPDTVARQLGVLRALPLYDNLDCTDSAKSDTVRCLAVHGWDASGDGESVRCELCRRSVNVADLVAIDDILADLPANRRDAPFFDVSSEHRAFCPWSQAAAHNEMLRAFGARIRNNNNNNQPQQERQQQRDQSLATLRAVKRLLGESPQR